MNKTDLEQIGALIDDKLEPIHKKLDGITDQLVTVSEDVTQIKETLESHEKRITRTEDSLGLTPTANSI